MTHEEYLLALQALVPGGLYCLAGTDYENILWDDSRPKPTQAQLDAALPAAIQARSNAEITRATERQEVLTRLGVTADEAQLLLGA
jgi:hypothetical protein